MQVAEEESVGKRACETLLRQKICRKIDLCKSPGPNLLEYRPVQIFQLHKSHFRQDFLSHASPRRPARTESVGISTCANLSVAQVAFPTDFFLSWSSRRLGHRSGRDSFSGAAVTATETDICQRLALDIDHEGVLGSKPSKNAVLPSVRVRFLY